MMATQHQQQPSPPGQSTTGPTCAKCTRPKQLDKILVACIDCHRHYHPACHRPLPRDPFTCASCCRRVERKRLKLKAARKHHGIKYIYSSQTTHSSSSVTTSTTADTMFSSAASQASSNPFLPDDQDDDSCCEPNCQEKALKPLSTCANHFISTPSAEKPPASNYPRNTSNEVSVRSLVSAVSPPARKSLDARTTARKSTRAPFFPAEVRLNKPLSANSRLSNGHSTNKAHHTRAPGAPLSESPARGSPARKKPRLISPRDEAAVLHAGRSASPLAMPNFQVMRNGNILHNNTAAHGSGKLPTLGADLRSFSPATTDLDGPQRPLLSYGDYLKSPLAAGLSFGGELSKLNPDVSSDANHSHRPGSSPSQKAPPAKIIPTRTKPGQHEDDSVPLHSKLKDVTRISPSEKQRRSVIKEEKATSKFDNLMYAQPGASQPPPGGAPVQRSEPKPQESILYAAIDPRSHRTRPHSEAWYQEKEKEIRARGGRKSNFGKATQSLKNQKRKDGPLEAGLPDRVLQNESWVSALRWFDEQNSGRSHAQTSAASSTVLRSKRPYRRRQPNPSENLES